MYKLKKHNIFEQEKKEHPSFTDKQVWQIVKDHLKKEKKKWIVWEEEGEFSKGIRFTADNTMGKIDNMGKYVEGGGKNVSGGFKTKILNAIKDENKKVKYKVYGIPTGKGIISLKADRVNITNNIGEKSTYDAEKFKLIEKEIGSKKYELYLPENEFPLVFKVEDGTYYFLAPKVFD